MPDYPIAVKNDKSTGPGLHVHVTATPPQTPPGPSVGEIDTEKQQGTTVFAYKIPVAVLGATGPSKGPPHCPGDPSCMFEVKEGMDTVLVTGIRSAFLPAGTHHCQTGNKGGPALNFLLPHGGNKTTVEVGGPVFGLGNAKGVWFSAFQSLGLGGMGQPGAVTPADSDGSDADANSGGTNPDGTGNGTNPNDPPEDEKNRFYPYVATLFVNGRASAAIPQLAISIAGEGQPTATVNFETFRQGDELGPYAPSCTAVNITSATEGASVRIEGDYSTVERSSGGGST